MLRSYDYRTCAADCAGQSDSTRGLPCLVNASDPVILDMLRRPSKSSQFLSARPFLFPSPAVMAPGPHACVPSCGGPGFEGGLQRAAPEVLLCNTVLSAQPSLEAIPTVAAARLFASDARANWGQAKAARHGEGHMCNNEQGQDSMTGITQKTRVKWKCKICCPCRERHRQWTWVERISPQPASATGGDRRAS